MLMAKNTKRIFTAVLGFAVIFLIASTAQARSNDSGHGNSTAYSQQSPPAQRDSRPASNTATEQAGRAQAVDRSTKSEVRNQNSENREQKTENRITEKNIRVDSQVSAVTSRNEQRQQVAAPIQAEDRGQRTENRGRKPECRSKSTESSVQQKSEHRSDSTEGGKRMAAGDGKSCSYGQRHSTCNRR